MSATFGGISKLFRQNVVPMPPRFGALPSRSNPGTPMRRSAALCSCVRPVLSAVPPCSPALQPRPLGPARLVPPAGSDERPEPFPGPFPKGLFLGTSVQPSDSQWSPTKPAERYGVLLFGGVWCSSTTNGRAWVNTGLATGLHQPVGQRKVESRETY